MTGYVFMRFGTDFKPENVDRLRVKVGECLDRCNIYGTNGYLLLNMMDELICNVLEHSKANWVEVEVHPEAGKVSLVLRDDGPEFDPTDLMGDHDLGKHVDLESGRHMGLYMVGKIAKSWNYTRINGHLNELRVDVDLERSEEKQ